ncbi:MAG: hypothetical protein MJ102_03920 [Clostridia bacterium]|nr:hypothetical protein [Clostridia bacterium]
MKNTVKTIICAVLSVLALLAFAACDDGDTPMITTPVVSASDTQTPEVPQDTQAGADDTSAPVTPSESYSLTYKNVKIIPGAEIAPIVAALGQPQNYMESPSCAFTGLDKIYTYPHFMIYSYPMNNVDYVYMVTLTDDIVSTDEGVKIGTDISSAVTAYGNNYKEEFGTYYFTKGKSQIWIKTENNLIKDITYAAVVD